MTAYLDSLRPLLPDDIRTQFDHALLPEIKAIVEAILRLAVGASAPPSCVLQSWDELQPRACRIMDELKRGELPQSAGQKRPRQDDASSTDSKRVKTIESTPAAENDPLVFSLNGISVSTPIRKKVNIGIHESAIRLTNPSSQKEECPSIPLSSLKRAFLLPTRGKSKPHWSVVLLCADVPAPSLKGPAAAKDVTPAQLVFGLDATLVTPITTTSATSSTQTHAKGTPSLPALRAFLGALPVLVVEPSATTFKSAVDGIPGVGAYSGAKEGTLWFLDGGVLWDGKPCEFFALEHLAPSRPNDPLAEGVRTLSATGRTCSVILHRVGGHSDVGKGGKERKNGKGKEKDGDANEDGSDEEDDGVDVDFGMVDGREQEPIGRWIKARRHLFGRPPEEAPAPGSLATSSADKGKGKAKSHEKDSRAEDTEDEEDEDFTMDSSDSEGTSDSGADDSDASQDADGDDGEGEAQASDEDDEDEAEEDDDEVQELDPKHHPLLRPGAMPRMSRAAVEAVVGMVEQDLMGGGSRAAGAVEIDEDEEDELDD